MFSNLSTGSVLYVLETKDNYKLNSGQIDSISNIRTRYSTFPNLNYMQNSEMVMDITATINGEKKEYKQIPTNLSIANFGDLGLILADSKDSMLGYINTTYQNSKSIVDNIEKYKITMANCEEIRKQLDPSLAAEAERDNAIAKLQNQVDTLTQQLSKALSALNVETKKE